MRRNRIMSHFELPMPCPHASLPSPVAFILVPLNCLPAADPGQWLWQQALYQKAREQAEAVVRPSLLERALLAAWN